MVHGGIGRHAQPQNTSWGDIGGLTQAGNDGIEGLFHNGILQFFLTARSSLLNNPVDHIRAITNLSVTGRALGQQLSGNQVGEHHGDGGSADVNGTAHNSCVLGIANLHAQEGISLHLALDTDMKMMLPKCGG